MNVLLILVILSAFFTLYYASMLVSDQFKTYLTEVINKDIEISTKVITIIEAVYLLMSIFYWPHPSQGLVFSFILTTWLLLWAMFIPPQRILADYRLGYLYLAVTVVINGILTYINLTSLWIEIK